MQVVCIIGIRANNLSGISIADAPKANDRQMEEVERKPEAKTANGPTMSTEIALILEELRDDGEDLLFTC